MVQRSCGFKTAYSTRESACSKQARSTQGRGCGGIVGIPARSRYKLKYVTRWLSGQTKDWLAVGQGSQQHLTTLSARPDLRRGQGPSVATDTHSHDAGRALTFGTLAASAMMRTSASSPRGVVRRNRLR